MKTRYKRMEMWDPKSTNFVEVTYGREGGGGGGNYY